MVLREKVRCETAAMPHPGLAAAVKRDSLLLSADHRRDCGSTRKDSSAADGSTGRICRFLMSDRGDAHHFPRWVQQWPLEGQPC